MPASVINVLLGLASAEFIASFSVSDCLTIHWVRSLNMTIPKETNPCVRGQRSPLFMALESLFHILRAGQSWQFAFKTLLSKVTFCWVYLSDSGHLSWCSFQIWNSFWRYSLGAITGLGNRVINQKPPHGHYGNRQALSHGKHYWRVGTMFSSSSVCDHKPVDIVGLIWSYYCLCELKGTALRPHFWGKTVSYLREYFMIVDLNLSISFGIIQQCVVFLFKGKS